MGWLKHVMLERYMSFVASLRPSMWSLGIGDTLELRRLRRPFMDEQGAAFRRALAADQAMKVTDVLLKQTGPSKAVAVPSTVPALLQEIWEKEKLVEDADWQPPPPGRMQTVLDGEFETQLSPDRAPECLGEEHKTQWPVADPSRAKLEVDPRNAWGYTTANVVPHGDSETVTRAMHWVSAGLIMYSFAAPSSIMGVPKPYGRERTSTNTRLTKPVLRCGRAD